MKKILAVLMLLGIGSMVLMLLGLQGVAQAEGPYSLLTYISPVGKGFVALNPDSMADHFNYCACGTVVGLKATPIAGWSFSHWSGDTAWASGDSATATMYGHRAVTATFAANNCTLTVNVTGRGRVDRAVYLSGAWVSQADSIIYSYGTVVRITAVDSTGFAFSAWGGDHSGSATPSYITMSGSKTVTATFALRTYTLDVTEDGSGSVTRDTTAASYPWGLVVTLTAGPDEGYKFTGWSDDTTATTNPLAVPMWKDKDITATFVAADSFWLHAVAVGGSINLDPPDTTLTGEDSLYYDDGQEIRLLAVPDSGYYFYRWHWETESGGGIYFPGATGPMTDVGINGEDGIITGLFAPDDSTATLSYSTGPNGLLSGDTVQVLALGGSGTAVSALSTTGYHFVAWSDGATQTIRTDSYVYADTTYTATFAINAYTLTYTAGANGSITGTARQTVNHGASGTQVTAVPATGYHFVSWDDGTLTAARTDASVTEDAGYAASFDRDVVPPAAARPSRSRISDCVD